MCWDFVSVPVLFSKPSGSFGELFLHATHAINLIVGKINISSNKNEKKKFTKKISGSYTFNCGSSLIFYYH